MAYSRVNWQDDKTPLSANNLNHMDSEIYNLSSSMDKILVGGKISGSAIEQNSTSGRAIIDGTIDGSKLASGAVTDSKISNGAVTTQKLALNSVIGGNNESTNPEEKVSVIAKNTITDWNIKDNAILTRHISNGAVTTNKIGNKTVTAGKLSSSGVVSGKTLISDGNGNVTWQSVPTASGTVQRIVYNGSTYSAVEGTATFNQSQADFNETDSSSPAFIKNKPSAMTLPTPTQEDAQKLMFVNALGNYALGCPTEFKMGNWLIQSSSSNGFVIKWIGGNS